MICTGFLKKGTPCKFKRLPGYDRCGRHGGISAKKCCILGDLDSLQHILGFTDGRITYSQFHLACKNKRSNIVHFVISNHNTREGFLDHITYMVGMDPYNYGWVLPIIDSFNMSSLSRCLENLESKIEDCHICQSDSCDVVVLPCCKNVICKECFSKWESSSKNSCAFCRGKIY